jgi:hypothetical protein
MDLLITKPEWASDNEARMAFIREKGLFHQYHQAFVFKYPGGVVEMMLDE